MGQVLAGPVRDPRAADLLRRYHERFGGSLEPPVPVEAIAEDLLGLTVAESESLQVSGMLLPGEREIWLNAAEPTPRRRFTLAHELGHWVCQVLKGRGAPVMCRADEVGVREVRALEREANVFAAELLMPEPAVREAWEALCNVATCAARFDVSPTAMQWRLFAFALVLDAPVVEARGSA